MDFELSDEQKLLRISVRDFAEKEIKPIARQLDEDQSFSVDLTYKMGELGLFGLNVPEEYGGSGMDTLSYIIAVEELARVDSSQAATVAAQNSLGIAPILLFGNNKQKDQYLPDLCAGKKLWAFGLTEPDAGSDSRASKTKAVFQEGNLIVNGSKIFITNGSTEITLGVTVQAQTGTGEEKEFSTILIASGTKGFTQKTMKDKMMWRASNTSELFFNDCVVPAENLLGTRGQGSKIMLTALDGGRLSIAAMGLGLAQGCYEAALEYSRTRKQFGQIISNFQAISFKLADMALKIELARTLLYKSCCLKDSNKPFTKESAMSKLYCSEIAREIADETIQVFGGYGLMKDYGVERFYRDQRLLQIGEGTSEIQRLIISRCIGC